MIDFKDDEAFGEQVNILVRVQQEIISTAFVVLLECRQEVVDIKVRERYLDVSLFHILAVHVPQILIEGIEAGNDGMIRPDKFDIGIDGRTEFACFGLGDMFISTFPEREQQRTDTFPFLHIEEIVIGIERIKGDRMCISIGEIDPVLTLGFVVDEFTQALIRVTRINQEDMCPLLVILAYHVVGKERLTTTRRTQDKFVTVGDDSLFHRQIRYIQVDGLTRKAVCHLDTEGRERILVVRLSGKKAERRLYKCIERLFRRKVCRITGNTRPVERCRINGVMTRVAFHKSKCRTHVILDLAKFFLIATPCQHIEVGTDRGQSL